MCLRAGGTSALRLVQLRLWHKSNLPFSKHHGAPIIPSASTPTRLSSEFIAHSYNHLFGLPATGLRFFTVYGPGQAGHGGPQASMWSENSSCRPRPVGTARRQRDESDVRKSVWSSPVLKRLSERIGIQGHASSDNLKSAHEPIPLPAVDCACSERR
jgi:hypothetical protein